MKHITAEVNFVDAGEDIEEYTEDNVVIKDNLSSNRGVDLNLSIEVYKKRLVSLICYLLFNKLINLLINDSSVH